MAFLKKTGSLLVLLFVGTLLIQPHNAEAQLLKKLKRKAKEKLEQKAEEKLDKALESSVDTAYNRIERLFGIRSRGSGQSEVLGQGEAGGFASLSFSSEKYSHDDFQDVVCTFFNNGVSIDAIVNEQYGLLLELINVPVNPSGHKGTYTTQAYSSEQGMLSNFEYYTRPGMPARVGSTLKEGTLTVASMDDKSIYFSFEGTGGNSETPESIKMGGTIKLDFSFVLQDEGMIENYAFRKGQKSRYSSAAEAPETTPASSMDKETESPPQAEEAMKMMQQMMGSSADIDLPDSYNFQYRIEYQMEGNTQGSGNYVSWLSSTEDITMINGTNGDGMMIMDNQREALVTIQEKEKVAYVMSSKISQGMTFDQSQMEEDVVPKKTGKTKSILGYKSEEYVVEMPNQEGKMTFWISEEVDIKMSGTLPGVAGFMSGGGLGKKIEGLIMEMNSTDNTSNETYKLTVKSIEKVSKRVKMSDYKVNKGFR